MRGLLTATMTICLFATLTGATEEETQNQFREIGQLDIDAYFFNLHHMATHKEWKKLSIMGETAIEACQTLGRKKLEWEITSQMILCYTEMGDVGRSMYHISRLREISDSIPNKRLVVENFCKIAAMLQSFADFLQEDSFAKGKLLNEAWIFTQEAEKIAATDPELLAIIQK